MISARPDFFIIGAMKCGTTSLAQDIERHGVGNFPYGKEPQLLTKHWDNIKLNNIVDNPDGQDRLIGDASPQYLLPRADENERPIRMKMLNPRARVACILRDPIARAISHYKHIYEFGNASEIDMGDYLCRDPLFVEASRYSDRLKPWIEAIGAESVLVLTLDHYRNDPSDTIYRLTEHLGRPTRIDTYSHAPANTAEDRRQTTPASKALGTVAGSLLGRKVKSSTPVWIKKSLLNVLTKPPRRDWKPASRQHLLQLAHQLKGENNKLRNLLGPDAPQWDLGQAVNNAMEQLHG